MYKKHFITIAEAIKEARAVAEENDLSAQATLDNLTTYLCRVLPEYNPAFSSTTFKDASEFGYKDGSFTINE